MRTANPDLQARRREEILAGAERCFLKRGFHQTSMQNIAAESGLSMGLLYRYFANKEAIITAVAQQDQDASLKAVAELPVDGDVITAWVDLLITMAKIASSPDYAALASEIFAEANRSPQILQMLKGNDAELALAIVQQLTEQQRSGAIAQSENLAAGAQVLMMVFDGLTMRSAVTGLDIGDHFKAHLYPIVGQILRPDNAERLRQGRKRNK